jgi:hypothetical protein
MMKNLEVSEHDGNTKSIHIQVGRTRHAILQAIEQSRWLLVR